MYLIVYYVFMLACNKAGYAGNLNMLLSDQGVKIYMHRVIHRLIPAYSLGNAEFLPTASVFSLPAKVYNKRFTACAKATNHRTEFLERPY